MPDSIVIRKNLWTDIPLQLKGNLSSEREFIYDFIL